MEKNLSCRVAENQFENADYRRERGSPENTVKTFREKRDNYKKTMAFFRSLKKHN
jgi:hypothetical protein